MITHDQMVALAKAHALVRWAVSGAVERVTLETRYRRAGSGKRKRRKSIFAEGPGTKRHPLFKRQVYACEPVAPGTLVSVGQCLYPNVHPRLRKNTEF